MIKVNSITVYRAKESEKLMYEAFRDKQFKSNQHIQSWVDHLQSEYTKVFGFDVKVYVVKKAKPDKEVDMMAVLMNTAEIMGQSMDAILSRSQKREIVDVRKTASMILLNMDYNPMDIEKQLPFKNRIVYDYRKRMEDRFATERGSEERFNEISKKVMKILLNGRYEI